MKTEGKTYTYYIAFFHSKGTGYTVIERDSPINTSSQLIEVIEYIKEYNKFEAIIPINWIELDTE